MLFAQHKNFLSKVEKELKTESGRCKHIANKCREVASYYALAIGKRQSLTGLALAKRLYFETRSLLEYCTDFSEHLEKNQINPLKEYLDRNKIYLLSSHGLIWTPRHILNDLERILEESKKAPPVFLEIEKICRQINPHI